ncbi:MAG: 50S ribosomal protein L22 [Candidatus Woesearchaeota archaeon]|nr:50S ribosomal protein L22 [Candidatus Woesearchaeota archaeon]
MKTAVARAFDVSVSTKASIEVCKFLRGKMVDDAIDILEHVVVKSQAVPFTRFTNGVGHKTGMAAGRYPVKVAQELLALLDNVKINAVNQGLSGSLKITGLTANKASTPMRNRSKYRGEFKRTHLELTVTEVAAKKEAKPKEAKKPVETAKASKKEEVPEKKPVEKQAEPKAETPAKKKEVSKVENPKESKDTTPKPAKKEETPKTEEKPAEKPKEAAKEAKTEEKN